MRPALLAVALLAALAAPAATTAPSEPRAALQAKLDVLVKDGAPGAILLVRDGDRTLRLTSGLAQRAPRRPMRADDRFRVGSVTKSFVAAVVLELYQEGKLGLRDSVERWLSGLVPHGDGITIRQLLNHTSGLFNYTEDPRVVAALLRGDANRWEPRELVGLAVEHEPLFEPGTQWSYSNTNYLVLGLVVEAAAGRPLEDELRERVFEPLRLTGTSLDSQPQIAGRYAHGYSSTTRGGRTRDVSRWSPSWAWAAGAVVSTVDDLATFYRGLFQGRLVTPHLIWRMTSTPKVAVGAGYAYGLGLAQTTTPCSKVWGHDGHVPGYLTFALGSLSGRRQVILALNGDVLKGSAFSDVADVLISAYCGRALR